MKQHTLKTDIPCTGVGLHSGVKVQMTLKPAPANTGIVFRRTDIAGAGALIPARWNTVADSRLCTVIANEKGVSVATIEHLMAALAAAGVDNAEIDINGPEVPAMDGSSQPFLFLIESAGIKAQDAPRLALKIKKRIEAQEGESFAALEPADNGFVVDFQIEFANPLIGSQRIATAVTPEAFKQDISRARTFGFMEDIPKMREAGLGLGGSLDNAIVIDGDKVLNEGGLRFADEFVRHKALDAIGDLWLAGNPMVGRFTGIRSSHAHNNRILQTLFADPDAWELVEMTEGMAQAPKTILSTALVDDSAAKAAVA